ncbi:MAG: PepSY domain-containing protein [Bacteroidales bacterium]|nr:PepSY domain-containing protein [Bacteroidales bacterium]
MAAGIDSKISAKTSRAAKGYKKLKAWHKWVSIVLTLFVLLFTLSGIVLNHRSWFSEVDVNRNLLPRDYRYQNWNLASLRGSVEKDTNELLVYGNIGVWKTNGDFSQFEDFNNGFPDGIDNRKISKIIRTEKGKLIAGTYFGLYGLKGDNWEKLPLPVEENRIVDLLSYDEKIYILTRSDLMIADCDQPTNEAKVIMLPNAEDDDYKIGLFKTLWVIHSGEIYGIAGQLFVDFMALALIFLTLTGLILWLFPGWIKRKRSNKSGVTLLVRTMKFSLKWHNKLGWYLAIFLIITAATGMFLRPPLLIPIANARVDKIPFSKLNQPNPWYDKLRAITYDDYHGRFILSTSEGFYYSDNHFSSELKKFETQPPVSVMGINVFEQLGQGGFLVGSFSGIFSWFPERNYVENVLTRQEYIPTGQNSAPFSEQSIAGMVWDGASRPYLFDYIKGAEPFLHEQNFPEMPREIVADSPMSIWNLALEVHTARIYRPLIGDFYILVIPLSGLALLFIVISGFWMYWTGFRRKS